MHVERPEPTDVDVPREHGQRIVERLFVRAPVVPGLPSCDESLDVGERDTVCPVCVLEFVGEGGELEFSVEEVELVVWNGDGEGCFGHRASDVDWDKGDPSCELPSVRKRSIEPSGQSGLVTDTSPDPSGACAWDVM